MLDPGEREYFLLFHIDQTMADANLGYGPAGIWALCGICRNSVIVINMFIVVSVPGFLGGSGSVDVLVALPNLS